LLAIPFTGGGGLNTALNSVPQPAVSKALGRVPWRKGQVRRRHEHVMFDMFPLSRNLPKQQDYLPILGTEEE
jgi:hypothetical protein